MLLGYLTFNEHAELANLKAKQKDPDHRITHPELDRIKELERKKWSAPVNNKLVFRNVVIKCPECGHDDVWNSFVVQGQDDNKFGFCKPENGGCGSKFVIHSHTDVQVKIETKKLE